MESRYWNYNLVSLITSFIIVVVFIPLINANEDFETLDLGHYCTHRERGDYIIQTQEEWEDLWQRTYSSSSEPLEIDFKSHIVIAVYMGERVTGGYHIEITSIEESGVFRWVNIRETNPSPTDLVTMALTQPYHLVKIRRNYLIILLIHT